MKSFPTTRRGFLRSSAGVAAATLAPGLLAGRRVLGANERPGVGCIGVGGMGLHDLAAAARYGDVLAVCDVDRRHAEEASDGGKRTIFEDYRKLLDRKDIDLVTISTPDHWHTRICIDALKAGKDVYCQKPLTLTIDEGKKLCAAVRQTGRVLQVGTQQRTENREMFLQAVAMCRIGRIGKLQRVTVAIGGAPSGGPFQKQSPPDHLNWDLWLGQAPKVEYIPERCHAHFRWWYEYSGGKMTDWGAHHVDIAQWAIGMDASGPTRVEPVSCEHPVELQGGMPTRDDRYNTATAFQVKCLFANGVEMLIRHNTENGITFEGEAGRFFVSREKLVGEPVDRLKEDPIPGDALKELRKGKPRGSHMGNFIACVKDRGLPVSDVYSHHRSLTTCHLANIAIRLGRALTWDPEKEEIVGDAGATGMLSRPQRKGFEVDG